MGWRGPMTHRQFLVWSAWLEAEWERPSRTDYYLMQVAMASGLGGGRSYEDYRIRFGREGEVREETLEERTERARADLHARMGKPHGDRARS